MPSSKERPAVDPRRQPPRITPIFSAMADAGEPNDVRARPPPARRAACSFCPVAPTSLFFRFPSARRDARGRSRRPTRLLLARARVYRGWCRTSASAPRASPRTRKMHQLHLLQLEFALRSPSTPSGSGGAGGPGVPAGPPPRGAARPERHPGATGARVPHGASPPQGRQLRRARRPRPTVVQASPSRRPRGRALPRCDRRPGYRAGEPRVEVHERLGRAQPRDPQRGAYAIPPRVVSPFPRTTTTPQTHSCARFARDDARS